MGLDIHGKSTGGWLHGGYSKLHFTTRFLALVWCGMPKYLDNNNEISSMSFYMGGYLPVNKYPDTTRLAGFIAAVQLSGMYFPNILLHSDCDGNYTKRGKVNPDTVMTGNSIQLMKELERIVTDQDLQVPEYQSEMEYTQSFYDLVKNEVVNGSGIITFG